MIKRISEKLGVEVPKNIINDTTKSSTIGNNYSNEDRAAKGKVNNHNFPNIYILSISLIVLILGITLPNILLKYFYNVDTYKEFNTPVKPQKNSLS